MTRRIEYLVIIDEPTRKISTFVTLKNGERAVYTECDIDNFEPTEEGFQSLTTQFGESFLLSSEMIVKYFGI